MKIYLKVKPNSPEPKIIATEKDSYRVHITSPPEKNKANRELVKLLSKKFNIPSRNITIKAGVTNKKKIIELK